MLRLDQDGAGRDDCGDCLQARCAHRLARLDKIHNTICNAERACCLDTATNVLDVGLELCILRVTICRTALLGFQPPEVLLRQVCEGSDDVLANQVLWLGQIALLGYLDLETAFAKVEIEDFNDTCRCCRRYTTFVLFDLVAASDSEVDATFANECGDVCSGEEDEREREVLDECDIEARVAVELDV